MRMREVGWVKRSETGATTGGLPLHSQKSSLLGFLTSTQPTTTYTPSTPMIGDFMPFYRWDGAGLFRLFLGRINSGETTPTG
ncbi:MAG: hypothetical protein RLZZ338_1581 [Cyanobacteriota bacterium]|jgi:hypothetical protein